MRFLLIFLVPLQLFGFTLPDHWYREDEISVSNPSNVISLIYGNSTYGYFETKPVQINRKGVILKWLPPGTDLPIEIIGKGKTGYSCLKTLQLPKSAEKKIGQAEGELTAPFYATNAFFPETGVSFVYILNRRGEMIWSYVPFQGTRTGEKRNDVLLMKRIGEGRFGILRQYERSHFEIIDGEGHLLQSLDPQTAKSPYVIHHDFIYKPDGHLITLGTSVDYARKFWKLFSKKVSFLETPMESVDLSNNTNQILWNYLEGNNPFYEPDWTFNEKDSGHFWTLWNQPEAENNFEHINSLQEYGDEGYLLSSRSLSKLIFIDHEKKNVLWTIGRSRKNTFSTIGTDAEFFRQHHATLLSENELLLFDNGKKMSRAILLGLDCKNHRVKLLEEWFPSVNTHSPIHGAVFPLPNGHFVAYFPNTTQHAGPNEIAEFVRGQKTEKGRIILNLGDNSVSYRALPLNQIGEETYLGDNVGIKCPSIK